MALNQAQLVNPPVGTRVGGVKAGTGISITTDGVISASGSGTVSSVAVSGTNGITTTGSPITGSGTITVNFQINSLSTLP